MEFARPWFLILLPLAALPLVWRAHRTALRFSSFRILPHDPLSRGLGLLERGLGALFLATTVLGLSEPRSTPHAVVRWTQGARIVFVVDQSASMFSPWGGSGGTGESQVSKLAVARSAIREFVRRRPGDQIALIGFGKASILYTPTTTDHHRFLEILDLLNTDLGDTVIDIALLRALELVAIAGEESPSRAVLLLSDGAGRVHEPDEIARRLREAGVSVYWLAIEGGQGGAEALHRMIQALGPLGKTFVVGEVNELPYALDAVGKLEERLVRVEGRAEGRAWTRFARMTALGALLLLGVFAFGERAARQGPRSVRRTA